MLAQLAVTYPQVEQTFAEASAVLGFDLWQLVQDGPAEELNRTQNTQPAMLAAGVAAARVWSARGGPRPLAMAGHSLGEYSALVCAQADHHAPEHDIFERPRKLLANRERDLRRQHATWSPVDRAAGRGDLVVARLEDRSGDKPVRMIHAELGGDAVHFVPGSSGLKVLDHRSGETRLATSADYVEYVRLADGLEHIAYLATAFSTAAPESMRGGRPSAPWAAPKPAQA